MRNIECLVEARFGVGESPVWDGANNRLLWSDNTTDEIHAIDLSSRTRQIWHFGEGEEGIQNIQVANAMCIQFASLDATAMSHLIPSDGLIPTVCRKEQQGFASQWSMIDSENCSSLFLRF